jgi:recombination protein RecA
MSQALRKLTGIISKSKAIVIFINQLREKVGVMFGNPETTTGGRALKFYASIRMEIRKGEAIKQGGEVIGNRARVKVVKNKVAPPFRNCEFDIMYGTGISREGTILDLGTSMDIIEKSGTWYSYKGERLGQGKENVKLFLKDHPEIADEVEHIIRDTLAAEPEKFDAVVEEVHEAEEAGAAESLAEPSGEA